jgi:hypothetical protein
MIGVFYRQAWDGWESIGVLIGHLPFFKSIPNEKCLNQAVF